MMSLSDNAERPDTVELVAKAIYESIFVDEWAGGNSVEEQYRQAARAAIEATSSDAFAGKSSPQPLSIEQYSEINHRLRRLVFAAYQEGFNDGADVAEGLAGAPKWERTRCGRELAQIDAAVERSGDGVAA